MAKKTVNSDKTIEVNFDKKKNQALIILKGNLNIQRAKKTKEIINSTISVVKKTYLKFEDFESLDISIIQILFAAFKKANSSNHQFELYEEHADFLKEIKKAGYHHYNWFGFN